MSRTILIVDDDPSLREAMRAVLEHAGYRVLEAAYLMGVEAMAVVNSDVQTVVLDGWVPWADGQSPILSIPLGLRLQWRGVHVVFHSADGYLCGLARKDGLTVVEKGSGIKELLEAVEGK